MSDKKKAISFEDALKELEEIAENLERGQLTLEESIKSYERGMELKIICTEKLKEAEGKIEVLSKSGSSLANEEKSSKKNKNSPESQNSANENQESLINKKNIDNNLF